jgi:hypothetical protein
MCNAGPKLICISRLIRPHYFLKTSYFSETLLNSVQLGLSNGQQARILLLSDMSLLLLVIFSRSYERKYCPFSRIYKGLSFPRNVGIPLLVDVALHTRKTEQ